MTRLSRVVPAILTRDPRDLEGMVRQAESFTDYVQFDIMDGQFVPSLSVTHRHLARLVTRLGWEVHLMVQQPEKHIANFQKAGAQKIIFHYEATPSPESVISLVKSSGLKIGLALNPETPLDSIRPLVEKVDSILLMTVNPGFYGSQFIPEVLDKVAPLRQTRTDLEIGVDGGIKESNVAEVARLGVDIIYVGSAIFRQPQPAESFRHLTTLAEEGSRQQPS